MKKSESGYLKDKMIDLVTKTAVKSSVRDHQVWLDSVNSILQVKPRPKIVTVESLPVLRLDQQRSSYDTTNYLLPPNKTPFIYTLVLDLDETLVHYDYVLKQFRVRPFCREFLRRMSLCYELVVFTAAHEEYANFILDQLDPDKTMLSHRLYRQHITYVGNVCIKDLHKLGRPMNRTVIVDNLAENFSRQPRNGIEIGTWKFNPQDR